jgi:short-subunit dehydrogenase
MFGRRINGGNPWAERNVVITGGTAGVGRATAREFARRGANVAVLAREQASLDATAAELNGNGQRAIGISVDVADAEQVEQAAEKIEQTLGPIDVWVNNAMTTIFAPFAETTAEEFHRATEVTYLGTVYGTMAALKRMRPRNSGTIVQVGSALAYRAIPLQAAYCGAKHAIRGFTDSVRSELLHDGVNVHLTMVQLPALNTPQFDWCRTRLPNHPQPVPPIFQPEVAAEAIAWAASHHRREVIVGWPSWRAIWANKFAPGFIDRYLAWMGFSSQQTDQPISSSRPDNLFSPLTDHHTAHGDFDARASDFSWQWWASKNRGWIAAALLSGVGLCMAARSKRRLPAHDGRGCRGE